MCHRIGVVLGPSPERPKRSAGRRLYRPKGIGSITAPRRITSAARPRHRIRSPTRSVPRLLDPLNDQITGSNHQPAVCCRWLGPRVVRPGRADVSEPLIDPLWGLSMSGRWPSLHRGEGRDQDQELPLEQGVRRSPGPTAQHPGRCCARRSRTTQTQYNTTTGIQRQRFISML